MVAGWLAATGTMALAQSAPDADSPEPQTIEDLIAPPRTTLQRPTDRGNGDGGLDQGQPGLAGTPQLRGSQTEDGPQDATATDGAAAAPLPISRRRNVTRQLVNPPIDDNRRVRRAGETIPTRQDPPVAEPVARLPQPGVYDLSEAAGAQRPREDDPAETAALPPPDIDDGLGATFGWLRVFPTLELRGGYSTNAGGSGDDEDDAVFHRVAPQVTARTLWSRHELEATAGGELTRYTGSADTDAESVNVGLRGRIDIATGTTLDVSATYEKTRLQRGQTGAPSTVDDRPFLHTRELAATLRHRINRLTLALTGTLSETDYENTSNRDGTRLDNGDLDQHVEGVRFRATYDISPKTEIFGEVFGDREIFDRSRDSSGAPQGSEGYGGLAGATWRPTAAWELSGSIGVETRKPRGNSRVTGVIGEAGAIWRPTDRTSLGLVVRRAVDTTTEAGASSVVTDEAELTASHAFRPDWTLTGSLVVGRDTFEGVSRTDERIEMAAGLSYQLNRYVAFVADIVHSRLDSDAAGQNDAETEVSAGVRLRY